MSRTLNKIFSPFAPGMLAALLFMPSASPAQPPPPDQPDLTLDAVIREEVITNIIKALDESYVFPETARRMGNDLRKRLEGKEYDEITSAKEFADTLTEHLRAVSNDKHLGVRYSYEPVPAPPAGGGDGPAPEDLDRMRRYGERMNFGFEKVERMPGNVGYLDLRGFMAATVGGEAASAAMTLLANTDALIVDLRQNGGGDPAMVSLITSYLFGPEPVHLNDLYFRPEDSTRQWWTLPHVAGKRFGPDKPVYVLTSRRTFSAAEEFTYNLKNLKRATIVGETTGGGAHPGGFRRLGDHFGAFIPSGRAINPISGTNWEGTGVEPDLCVPADLALKAAYVEALEAILASESARETPDDPMRIEMLKKTIEEKRKELDEAREASGASVAEAEKRES